MLETCGIRMTDTGLQLAGANSPMSIPYVALGVAEAASPGGALAQELYVGILRKSRGMYAEIRIEAEDQKTC
ncbi:hypothetical protein D9M68_69710 [compost metagenome]